ncbi:MAG: hypothetical protein R2821_02015 [Flavobacteriaceae bacterium]
MKSTILRISSFLFFSLSINAQSSYFNIIESEKFVDNYRNTSVNAVHTTDNNTTLVARTAKRKLIFEAYDEQAKNIFNVFTDS